MWAPRWRCRGAAPGGAELGAARPARQAEATPRAHMHPSAHTPGAGFPLR